MMKGFSLIEVMLALLILSIGLLGIAGMQLKSFKNINDAYYHSAAIIRLSSMMERLRSNTSGEARARELLRWNAINAAVLPGGEGSYSCYADNCTVTINWQNKTIQTQRISGRI